MIDQEARDGIKKMNAALNKFFFEPPSKPLPAKHNKRQWQCKNKMVGPGKWECLICGKKGGPGWGVA